MSEKEYEKYYVPAESPWPFMGAVALFLMAVGAGNFVVESTRGKEGYGAYILGAGFLVLVVMLFGWFRNQIHESMSGLYSAQLGRSYRQGMAWFIFSEVMFFGAFFGALFYARFISVPWLGGASNNDMTGEVLWPAFEAIWPLVTTPGGLTTEAMPWTGLPLINTFILHSRYHLPSFYLVGPSYVRPRLLPALCPSAPVAYRRSQVVKAGAYLLEIQPFVWICVL